MLDHLGEKEAAKSILNSIEKLYQLKKIEQKIFKAQVTQQSAQKLF